MVFRPWENAPPPNGKRMPQGLPEELAGERGPAAHDRGERSLGHHVPAVQPAAGAEVHHVLRPADGLLVVLHHDDGVSLFPQGPQRVQEHEVVPRVQADGGLIEDVADPAQLDPSCS